MIQFRRHLATHSSPNESETFQQLLVSKSARCDDANFMCLAAHGDFESVTRHIAQTPIQPSRQLKESGVCDDISNVPEFLLGVCHRSFGFLSRCISEDFDLSNAARVEPDIPSANLTPRGIVVSDGNVARAKVSNDTEI